MYRFLTVGVLVRDSRRLVGVFWLILIGVMGEQEKGDQWDQFGGTCGTGTCRTNVIVGTSMTGWTSLTDGANVINGTNVIGWTNVIDGTNVLDVSVGINVTDWTNVTDGINVTGRSNVTVGTPCISFRVKRGPKMQTTICDINFSHSFCTK